MTELKKLWRRIRGGLLSLFLLLSLTACALRPVVTPQALPSASFYATDIQVPALPENAANADLVRWGLSLIEAINLANADRAALRVWASNITKEK